ncbi:MAG: nitrate- and nitrite sensing domain-containing protein [Mycobacteriales bacterium]
MVRNSKSSLRSRAASIRAWLLGVDIRTKTLGVVAVPMIFLLLFSTIVVSRSFGDSQRAQRVTQLAAVSTELSNAVAALQHERGATLGYVAHRGSSTSASMLSHWRLSDIALGKLRSKLDIVRSAGSISPAVDRALAAAGTANRRVPGIRTGVEKSLQTAAEVQAAYNAVIEDDLALPDLLADAVTDTALARTLRAYGAISHLVESAAQERDAIVAASGASRFTPEQYVALAGDISDQNAQAAALTSLVTPTERAALTAVLKGPQATSYLDFRRTAIASGSTKALFITTADYSTAANKRLAALGSIQSSYAGSATRTAGKVRSSARLRAELIAVLVALGLSLPLLHALVLSRRIVKPLLKLIDSAEAIRIELPLMVERMRQPGQDPEITIEPIRVDGNDEVGRLTEAFNTVNEVTVQVAVEQAALRGSIAEMFVNVARRNQALLGRQLAFLDQLEAGEEDPDTLRNLFHLDHLAAQMRRNAESLLVLAGIVATRRLRAPMPLVDVIRTATGEIEGFARVQLRPDVNPEVTGMRALSVAHLLAELLDNATRNSDPQTKVQVAASFDGQNVVVDIYDEGLGMSPEELAAANHRLAAVAATEIAVAQQLGLYVVGRIAQRLDIGVALKTRETGGTVAVVTLPASLFVDGSLPVTAMTRTEPAALPIAAVAEPEAAADELPTLLPVTDSRRRRRLHPSGLPKHAQTAPAAFLPSAAGPLEMPQAVQDILPGRSLRRLNALPMPPSRPATPSTAAPAAAPAGSPASAPAGSVPAPVASSDADHPAPDEVRQPLPIPAQRDAFPQAGDAPAAETPVLEPVAALAPAQHSPRRTNEAARSALAELSMLSSAPYTPSYEAGTSGSPSAAPELARRTPKAAEVKEPVVKPIAPPAPRSAEHVRGQLSGFRAGVTRGRHAQDEVEPDHGDEDQS